MSAQIADDSVAWTPELWEVAQAFEGDLPQNSRWIEWIIAVATRRLRAVVGNLGAFDPELVKDIIIGAVLRVVRNPGGMRSETEGGYSYAMDTQVASGRLWFTPDELALLGLGAGGYVGMFHAPAPCWRWGSSNRGSSSYSRRRGGW